MTISIDQQAGFCPGVVRTIQNVETEIANSGNKGVYIIGEIIHNPQEISRLKNMGLTTVSVNDLKSLPTDSHIIIRAHGEPPSTYDEIQKYNLQLNDATCPLVRNLQHRVEHYYQSGYGILIYGKKDHPEVIGLCGVCCNTCIVIDDRDVIPTELPVKRKTVLLSQTTSDYSKFNEICRQVSELFRKSGAEHLLQIENTICANVSSRETKLKDFVSQNDVVVFVAGRNSSNGRSLYNTCCTVSANVHFIESEKELKAEWFSSAENIGITGATSTPKWFLNEIEQKIKQLLTLRN